MKKYTREMMNFMLHDLEVPDDLGKLLAQEESDFNDHHYYRFLYKLAFLAQPKLILELGTYAGLGCKCFKRGAPDARVITIDIHFNPDRKNPTPGVEYWRCTSLDPKEKLENIDILFVDTEHDGSLCLYEFNFYEPMLSPHGIVLFDDINLNDQMQEFWDDFTPSGFEKFELPVHGDSGFGVVIKQ